MEEGQEVLKPKQGRWGAGGGDLGRRREGGQGTRQTSLI